MSAIDLWNVIFFYTEYLSETTEFIVGLSFAIIVASFVGQSILTKKLYLIMGGIYVWVMTLNVITFITVGERFYFVSQDLINSLKKFEGEIPNTVQAIENSFVHEGVIFLKYINVVTYSLPMTIVTLWFIYYMGWKKQ